MFRSALHALILVAGIAPALDAQTRFLQPGDEVRIYVLGVIETFEGVLQAADSDELQLLTGDGAQMTIARDQIERSEVLGSRTNTLRGAAVGLGLGLAAGIGAQLASSDSCDRDLSGICSDFGNTFNGWLLVVPPVLGAGVGALLGSAIKTDRWFPAFLPRASDAGGTLWGLTWKVPLAW